MSRLAAPAAGCLQRPEIAPSPENKPGESKMREHLKSELHRADEALAEQFWDGADVAELVRTRAWAVEQLLVQAWSYCVTDSLGEGETEPCLVAVGGFGRGQLHPHSDVDLLILTEDERHAGGGGGSAIEKFVRLLWDAGFYLGHSVRTVAACEEEARADVSTATSLMEARLISGSPQMFAAFEQAMAPHSMWSASEFFAAKFEEQLARHARYNETAYNLEPNIKEGPGGLRDIQMVAWVAKRHFGAQTLHGLVDHGFLTESEHTDLQSGRHLLWRVRFALHLLAGRAEDRLLFDYQRDIAKRFGYSDGGANLAVEQFMQLYYRSVMQLERLNERLLQLFEEDLLLTREGESVRVSDEFSARHGYLEVNDPQVFARRPAALMELFVVLARSPELRGVRASTIRIIRDSLHLVDDAFRQDAEINALFLELLSQPQGIYSQLSRMNRYGILAAYLPVFGNIVGRMQYDLFHVYTVDQHTLFVVRNLRRFAYGKYGENFPHAQAVFRRIDQPELLYLAALFHDIAKGRGGDHSELGAVDAEEFCARLDIEAEDRDLVRWLVEQHLLMSRTAQRKDISDPATIQEFAARVATVRRLDYLYLLTMADIAATSPKLWNSWKNSLLWDLYLSTGNALRRGLQNPVERDTRIRERRSRTLSRLLRSGMPSAAIQRLWDVLPQHAFIRLTAGQLEWTTRMAAEAEPGSDVIAIRSVQPHDVSEVLVCVSDQDGLFAAITSVFDEMHLDVLAARILTTRDGRSFDLFQLMDQEGDALIEADAQRLKARLAEATAKERGYRPVQRRMPRRLRHFENKAVISFSADPRGQGTLMEVDCKDSPGLLSKIAGTLASLDIQVHDARIATFGERVEDTFLLSDSDHQPLSEEASKALAEKLGEVLDQ